MRGRVRAFTTNADYEADLVPIGAAELGLGHEAAPRARDHDGRRCTPIKST